MQTGKFLSYSREREIHSDINNSKRLNYKQNLNIYTICQAEDASNRVNLVR